MKDELGGSEAAVGLAVGAMSASAVLVRPFVGRTMDVRGRRPFLLGALALLCVSSLGYLVADHLAVVVFLRLLQGAAGGTFYTTAATMATDLAPVERRASAIAKFSLFLYAGFAAGPAIAEWVIRTEGFTPVWLLASGLALVGALLVLVLPESGHDAVARRRELGPPARRLVHPGAVLPGLVLMTTGMGYASITGFSALYARHVGLESSGVLYVVFAAVVIGIRLVSGRLADTIGRVAIALPGLALCFVGLGTLAVLQRPVFAFVGVAAYGAGFALIFPALMAFTVDRVPDHERGEALGSFTAFMDIGQGGGASLIGALVHGLGFGAAYGTPALLCLGGAFLLAHGARRREPAAVG